MKALVLLIVVLNLMALSSSPVKAQDFDDYYEMTDSTSVPMDTPSTVIPSSTETPSTTETTTPSSSTVNPTTTPAPPPANPQPQSYHLQDHGNSNKVCLNMSAVLQLMVTNGSTTLLNVTLSNDGEKGVTRPESTCSITNHTAMIFVGDQSNTFTIELAFNGTDKFWSIESVGVVYNSVSFLSKDDLDSNSQNVSSTRSFQCKNLTFSNFSSTENANGATPTLTITTLKVQVFEFKEEGKLGSAISCTADASQNKIVPIAVGAALAGLVIVVLIAYLIGRLRSRKQSSYEALS